MPFFLCFCAANGISCYNFIVLFRGLVKFHTGGESPRVGRCPIEQVKFLYRQSVFRISGKRHLFFPGAVAEQPALIAGRQSPIAGCGPVKHDLCLARSDIFGKQLTVWMREDKNGAAVRFLTDNGAGRSRQEVAGLFYLPYKL